MQIVRTLRQALEQRIAALPGAEGVTVAVEVPPRPELGDLATPVCFELARRLRRAPRAIAEEIARAVEADPLPGAARVAVAGGGYLNIYLDRNRFVRALAEDEAPAVAGPGGKVIVEHTNINPNKAAHVGHLRNAVLGDTLVRCLRFLGGDVEVQNYIDDTGVQVADLVVGFREIEGLDAAGVRRLAESADAGEPEGGDPFDHLCWDLYARVAPFYEEDASRKALRGQTLRAMEHGEGPESAIAAFVSARMVRHHLRTMERTGVRYDLLPRESDILRLEFWARAFEHLKSSGAITLSTDGKNSGCWVMDLDDEGESGEGDDQKIIVRSDGTVTYVGKDIAYQLWKFGRLGRDFEYGRLSWEGFPWSGYPVWETRHETGSPDHPAFGGARRVYNVIDVRQSYLQRVVARGLRALGHERDAEESIHFSYEMVALSPASVALLFPDYPLSDEDRARPYLEISGRRGLGVKADTLIDELVRRARSEVDARHASLPDGERAEIASLIARAALRYYMLRITRNRVVSFDIEDALAFEGETGPYCQYAVVRARNIFRRIEERDGDAGGHAGVESLLERADLASIEGEEGDEHWVLVTEMARLAEVVEAAVDALELSAVARYCHRLAQSFNTFYHRYPVMKEADENRRAVRLAICRLFVRTMERGLGLLGVAVPERM